MKILVVDDNPVNQKLMVSMLSGFGVCSVAGNGTAAVEMFTRGLHEKDGFTLVCLDIMIPEMDGQEVLQCIRDAEKNKKIAAEKRSKVMMVSSLDDSENIMKAFTKGHCDAYIMKPVHLEKLKYHLREIGLISQVDD